jgi:hypothetical protein
MSNEENNSSDPTSTETETEVVVLPLSDREHRIRQQELSDLIARAEEALADCTKFADKYHLSFGWSPAYGMGGYYYGDPKDKVDKYGEDRTENGWRASSQSC